MIIDLGCGESKQKDDETDYVIGIDFRKVNGVDIIADIDKYGLPFKSNSIDKIYAYHVLEHLPNVINIFPELYRCLKSGGIVKIRVPFFASSLSFKSLEHVKRFGYTTLDF
ncbi:MAG: methyltransferase domain-containing protein [Thermoplasmata archaeon]